MKVLSLNEVEAKPRHAAIGTFDGVHLGHRKVIDGADTVITFSPHPVAVVRPEAAPKLLTQLPLKAKLIEALGVEELVVIDFDQEFELLTADQFIEQILIEKLDVRKVSVGENFRFGFHAKGDPEMLAARSEFETNVVKLVEEGGEIISSTQIRGLVAAGDVERADELLGHPFALVGEVVHGDKRGRELGFPTANLVPDEHVSVPGHGVYAARTNGVISAVNVGIRPSFKTGRGLLVESFLIDWSGDLYGQTIEVEFVKRLRGERRYDDVEALIAQMHLDVADARAACAQAG